MRSQRNMFSAVPDIFQLDRSLPRCFIRIGEIRDGAGVSASTPEHYYIAHRAIIYVKYRGEEFYRIEFKKRDTERSAFICEVCKIIIP